MKQIFKLIILTIIISFTSCEDNEKDPIIGTGNEAPFVKYISNTTEIDLADDTSAISGTFDAVNPELIEKHEVFVAINNGNNTLDYKLIGTITSFPTDFSATKLQLTEALGVDADLPFPGDSFLFQCKTTAKDGMIITRRQTIDNGAGETASAAQQQGYSFNGVVICPFFYDEVVEGTYDVVTLGFGAFFGETNFERQIIKGPGPDQITIVEGQYTTELSDPLILTIDDEGIITSVNEDGMSFGLGPVSIDNNLGINNYRLEGTDSKILSCVGLITLNLNFSVLNTFPHSFILRKQ